MSGSDSNARTLAAYEDRAQTYRDRTQALPKDDWLLRLATDAPAGTVLEIGSAHGRDALTLESYGRAVERTDATRAFVDMLRADGHPAEPLNVLTDDIPRTYAAVLANAVFLHFQPGELRMVLDKVRSALVPSGLLAFSVKVGHGSEWSSHKLGVPRFFQYWQPEPLRDLVTERGFRIVSLEVDGAEPWDWIRVTAAPAAAPPL